LCFSFQSTDVLKSKRLEWFDREICCLIEEFPIVYDIVKELFTTPTLTFSIFVTVEVSSKESL